MTIKAPIAIVYTTRDEEINLPYALASVRDWAQQIFVLDSGSTDRTRQVAEEGGAAFVFHEWMGYARQKNWAIDNLPIETPWIFILDADEAITPKLRDEMIQIATEDKCPENGFYVNRFFVFLDKRIRHCGYYPSWNIRFFRRGKAHYEDRAVHEHMFVDGTVGYLKHDMEHNDRRGLHYYITKHNQYSTLEAREMAKIILGHQHGEAPRFWSGPTGRRRWIKRYVWPKIPLRWLARFFYMYVLKLGVLDGVVGFNFCLFMAAYEHQVGLKLKEILMAERQATPPSTGGGS
jgi:glycosyltransferase involved in cell wall biosynthesis